MSKLPVPQCDLAELSKFLNKHLDDCCKPPVGDENSKKKKEIHVLCLGFLYIVEYLGYWLKEKKQQPEYEIWIDILPDRELNRRVENKQPVSGETKGPVSRETLNTIRQLKSLVGNRLGPPLHLDIDGELKLEKSYDIILNLHYLHNSVNWRLNTIRILTHLKDKGIFIFSEVGGTYAVLDGNFKNIGEEIAKGSDADQHLHDIYTVLKKFDKQRNEEYYFWNPELSLTKYQGLRNQIEMLFGEIVDHESVKDESRPADRNDCIFVNSIEIRKNRTFRDLLQGYSFSYYTIGILGNGVAKMIDEIDKKGVFGREMGDSIVRKDNLYICKEFNSRSLARMKERHWNYNVLLNHIGHLQENAIHTLRRKALDIFISHDIFFPGYTKSIAIISWELNKDQNLSYPIHVVYKNDGRGNDAAKKKKVAKENGSAYNGDDVIRSAKKLQYIMNSSGFDILRALFKYASTKFPWYISLVRDADELCGMHQEGYTVLTGEGGAEIAYHVERNRKDVIVRINLAVASSTAENILVKNQDFLSRIEHQVDTLRLDKEVELKPGVVSRAELVPIENRVGLINEPEAGPKINWHVFTCNDHNGLDRLNKLLAGLLKSKNNEAFMPKKDAFLEWIITVTILLQLKKSGERIGYIPASVVHDDGKKLNESITGLGGVVMYENLPEKDNPGLGELFLARDKALEEAVNLIFYKAALASHEEVNRELSKTALKSAVAAISARSGSHTLGSHVLPEVCRKLDGLYHQGRKYAKDSPLSELEENIHDKAIRDRIKHPDNPLNLFSKSHQFFQRNTDYLVNERELFKYLQERLDFITQIVGDLPQWSLSMNFVGELLKPFYQQYHILNSLGDTEGLAAYKYIKRKVKREAGSGHQEKFYVEDDWFQSGKHLADQEHVSVYSHCLPLDGEVVLVSSRKKAQDLIDGKDISEDPGSLGIIRCHENATPDGASGSLYEILQKGWKAHAFFGQKIKIFGDVVRGEGNRKNEVSIKNCQVEGNKLVVKVRIRRYLILENNQVKARLDYSKALSEKNERLLDIGKKKIQDDFDKPDSLKAFDRFFGVIESVTEPSDENQVWTFTLFSSKKVCFKMSVQTYAAIQASLHAYKNSETIRFKKELFCVGARVILEGKITPEDNERYQIAGLDGHSPPAVKEVSFIDYITTTSNLDNDLSYNFLDSSIAIPGGSVGTQAFYIILENIIRNAAKHNWIMLEEFYKVGKNLEVKIELEDHNNHNYYICKIWTNTTNLHYQHGILYKGEPLDDFLNHPDNLTNKINNSLTSNIIANDGTLERSNLGLSEIKICAAFLAKYNWFESGVLHGKKILLMDKEGIPSQGFIRASMILEEDAGVLVPRLGYRFKLLKPKEVVIIGTSFEKSKEVIKYGVLFNDDHHDAKDEGREEHDDNGVAYVDAQFCIFYADGKSKNFGNDAIRLISSILSPGTSVEEGIKIDMEEKIHELSHAIENYPCRLFVVTSHYDVLDKMTKGSVFQTLTLDEAERNALLFFKKRICLLRKDWFDRYFNPADYPDENAIGTSIEKFKNDLYEKWLHMFTSSRHLYDLKVSLQTGSVPAKGIGEDGHSNRNIEITVPYNLRSDAPPAEALNKELREGASVNLIGDRSKNGTTYTVCYSRHDNTKKHNFLFSAGISGASTIYSLLKNAKTAGSRNVKYKLLENGLTTIMLLDERIMNYAHNMTDNGADNTLFHVFQNMNLIVPYRVVVNDSVIYESKLKMEADSNQRYGGEERVIRMGKEGEGDKKADECKGFNIHIYFKQPLFTVPERSSNNDLSPDNYNISSLVIHQTMLDHLCKGLYPEECANSVQSASGDKVIFRLKHEARIPCIIITSGRGRSANSSKYAKFMPFSNISHLLLRKDPDKFNLTQLLLQSLNIQPLP